MGGSVLDKIHSIIKEGSSSPLLSAEERESLLRFENAWKKIVDGVKPFLILLNPTDKKDSEIHRAIVEVAFGMYFFSARTCDAVDSLSSDVRNTLEVAKMQLEYSKADCAAAKRQAQVANRLAWGAISIALVSLLAGIWTTVYFGRCAHKDSDASTAAIVEAIKDCAGRTRQ